MDVAESADVQTNNEKSNENEHKLTDLEALVTPEQVLSASVARRRRNLTRRRSSSTRRDQTPVRHEEEEEQQKKEKALERPKTPERRRKKVVSKNGDAEEKNSSSDNKEDFKEALDDVTINENDENKEVKINEETPENINKNSNRQIKTKDKKEKIESIISVSQTELVAMFDKAKQKIKSGRDKYRKKEVLKRSQSAPRNFSNEELMESFRRAQMASAEREIERKRSSSVRKYSTDSSSSEMIPKSTPKPIPRIPKSMKPQKVPKQQPPQMHLTNRKFEQRPVCNKIVEILDPKTSRVIKTKQIMYVKFNFIQFLKMLKIFTIKDIIFEYKRFKNDMKHEHEKILNLRRKCINELILMGVLCGLGGVLFKFIEGAFENFYKCGVKRIKRDFIDQLWMKSHNLREEDWKSLARNKLKHFEEELHVAHEAGIRSYTGKTSWSFLNGIIYSLTLVTTIGYGHMFPTTITGKGLTILYALIGIPLFLIILTDFGKLFTRCIKYVWAFVRRLYYTGRCRKVRKTAHVEDIFKGAQMVYEAATLRRPSKTPDPNIQMEEGTDDGGTSPATPAPSNYEIDDEFNLPITLALSILVLYIFLGAVGFQVLENWDFFSSFYFVFISLSTIGLGDFVPSNNLFMIFSIVYLVFGLALMSMCINVVQDKISDTFKRASAKIGATIGLTVNEEDGSIITVPPDQVEMPEVHNAENIQKDINKNNESKDDEIIMTKIK
ncbi:uncharacterized protein [Onthophagus taurus]|uniref:uncharacterized protein n=1 Tax=Onthophagus taurus TaxID=166361 RepID=UPI0039BE247B